MKLDTLSLEECQQVRRWRNEVRESLRTSYMISEEMQGEFYRSLYKRDSVNRYWAIKEEEKPPVSVSMSAWGREQFNAHYFIGMGGLINIEWENRRAEISLIINPDLERRGYGGKSVDLLLDEGFNRMNLQNIWGECYKCSPSIYFWKKMIEKYNSYSTTIPCTKYWDGKYWNSLMFNFNRKDYR